MDTFLIQQSKVVSNTDDKPQSRDFDLNIGGNFGTTVGGTTTSLHLSVT